MLKLLEILQTIYLDKLMFKSTEFKLGFERAINIVKIHGFSTEVIQETKMLREEMHKLRKEIEFLKERLQLKKEEVQGLIDKNNHANTIILNYTKGDTKKSIKRLNLIKKQLTDNRKTSDEKVYGVLAYIKSIKELGDSEDGQSSTQE